VILNNNKRVARFLLSEKGPVRTASEREDAATHEIAVRDHVILCGFGRVGQNVARVLESQGFEYIALDLDPARIRAARQAGDPVMFGDSADQEMLAKAGRGGECHRHQFLKPSHLDRHPAHRAWLAPGGAGAGAHPG
jgi:CPA2 family monovalent cation:H+ antiporter-2